MEESAEDGGFDVAPFEGGGFAEETELGAVDRKGFGGGEEAAVEVEEFFAKQAGDAALVHVLEELLDEGDEGTGIVFEGIEELFEGVLREEADVFREHTKEAPREEFSDVFCVVFFLKGFGEFGEVAGNLAGNGSRFFGRVESERGGPDEAEAFADIGVGEVREFDTVRAGVGRLEIVFPFLSEVGVKLDDVSDIDDEEEGRGVFVVGEGAGVALGLTESLKHRAVPSGRAAGDLGRFGRSVVEIEREVVGLSFGGGVLFRFEDETAALVEIDASDGGLVGPAMMEGDGALENVGVVGRFVCGGIGARDVEHVAELGEEQSVISALGGADAAPAFNESSGELGVVGDGGGVR